MTMLLTRRAALTLTLSALAAPALIRPALAACKPLDLGKGIAFGRQDGSRGIATRKGDVVVIDYVTNRGAWTDYRVVKNGVFETSRTVEESEEPMVGASAPTYTWTYSPKIIMPEDGATWSGRIKELVEVTISDENATVQRQRYRWQAIYRCFEPREVTLSGCTHAALTVEAAFSGEVGGYSQRWVYFPDLGLGLETRRNGVSNGLTAMTPA
ncbi:MAG: hypothetical protein NTW20_15775 [Rhodobacterales bacterium]|nr:hypothetical protein [Rhodobacterales bacterium]